MTVIVIGYVVMYSGVLREEGMADILKSPVIDWLILCTIVNQTRLPFLVPCVNIFLMQPKLPGGVTRCDHPLCCGVSIELYAV